MPIPDDEYKKLKCCLDNTHIVHEAILNKCGGNACKNCIDLMKLDLIKCCYCNENHKKDEIKSSLIPNSDIETEIRTKYLNDLIEDLKVKISNTYEALQDETLTSEIEHRINLVENDIDLRIESLIEDLQKIRDEMKIDLKNKKDELLKSENQENLKTMKEKIEICKNHDFSDGYESFIKHQNILKECDLDLNNFKKNIQQLKFVPNVSLIDKTIVGGIEITDTGFTKAKSRDRTYVETNELTGLVYLKSERKIVVINFQENLFVLDHDGNYLEKIDEHLDCPISLCLDKNDNVFVFNQNTSNVAVFDSKMKFIREFRINDFIYSGAQMRIDSFDESNPLYIANYDDHMLLKYDSQTGECLGSVKLQSPFHLEFTQDKIFVSSLSTFFRAEKSKELASVKGENCIYMLDKNTRKLIHHIKFNNWYRPYGLALDSNQNILTVANTVSESYDISDDWFLYIINSNDGSMLRKINIGVVDDCRALAIYDNRILMPKYDGLEIITLE